jgi:hypothetical protein
VGSSFVPRSPFPFPFPPLPPFAHFEFLLTHSKKFKKFKIVAFSDLQVFKFLIKKLKSQNSQNLFFEIKKMSKFCQKCRKTPKSRKTPILADFPEFPDFQKPGFPETRHFGGGILPVGLAGED